MGRYCFASFEHIEHFGSDMPASVFQVIEHTIKYQYSRKHPVVVKAEYGLPEVKTFLPLTCERHRPPAIGSLQASEE